MFQVNWVAQQTYLVNFWSKEDFDVINAKRWQWFGSDAAIIRIWTPDANLEEDALDSIPQLMILHDILFDMSSSEAISRISSVLRDS